MLSLSTLIGIAIFAFIFLLGGSVILAVIAFVIWRRSSRQPVAALADLVATPLKPVTDDDEDDLEVQDVKTIFKAYRTEKRLANVKELMAEACTKKA